MSRLECNLEILEYLKKEVQSHPYLRFGQLLAILGINQFVEVGSQQYIKDNFYEESSETLSRLVNCEIFEKTSDTSEKRF